MRELARESLTDKPKSDLKQLLDTKNSIALSPLRFTNLENKLSFYLTFYIINQYNYLSNIYQIFYANRSHN